jgi:hypothetical protein
LKLSKLVLQDNQSPNFESKNIKKRGVAKESRSKEGRGVMDTSFSLRIDANAKQWGGNNSPQGDRQNRRRQKLQALLQALKAGELDAARLAFTALINFDPSVSFDPYLHKIGSALQSSNLYAAQHFGLELQSRGGQLQSNASVNETRPTTKRKDALGEAVSLPRIDLSA